MRAARGRDRINTPANASCMVPPGWVSGAAGRSRGRGLANAGKRGLLNINRIYMFWLLPSRREATGSIDYARSAGGAQAPLHGFDSRGMVSPCARDGRVFTRSLGERLRGFSSPVVVAGQGKLKYELRSTRYEVVLLRLLVKLLSILFNLP